MTWVNIAVKDFRDAVQSRALWALVGVFVVLLVASSFAYTQVPEMFGEPAGATFGGLILFTVGFLGLFVPIAAIVVGYKSIAGERESGSIKLVLSMPTTRTDLLVGKVIGRAAVLTVGLGVGVIVGLAFGGLLIGGLSIASVAILGFVTFLFVLAYASIIVGLSALTGSTSRATTYALGFFVIAELLWDVVPLAVLYVVEGFSKPTEIPDWGFALMQLSPSSAFLSGVISLLPEFGQEQLQDPGMAASDSFFVTPEFGFVVLVFWIVVPVLVAYRQFNAADL